MGVPALALATVFVTLLVFVAVLVVVLILAAVLIVGLIAVLVIVLAIVLVAVLVIVLIVALVVLILIAVLIIHCLYPPDIVMRHAATIACPIFQALSFGLNKKLASKPAVMAAVIPPAVAFKPPMKMPRNPSSCTASFTPLAML